MRGRNSKPHNPRTIPQVLHRSLVATCYKFTSILPDGLLEGAFDDARRGENWQQSFLRHNTHRACRLTKDKAHDPLAAAFGRWRLSDGPLPSPELTAFTDVTDPVYGLAGLELSNRGRLMTVAELSALLVQDVGLQDGDVLTFVAYNVGSQLNTRVPSVNSETHVGVIDYAQLKLDSYDTTILANALPSWFFVEGYVSASALRSFIGVKAYGTAVAAFGVVVSRRDGTRVSHNVAEVKWAGAPDNWWERYETDSYLLNVLRSWGASKQALLEAGYWKL